MSAARVTPVDPIAIEHEVDDRARRAKTLDRAFGWCERCCGPLTDGACAPCDEEQARDQAIRDAGVERAAANHGRPDVCPACAGSGVVESFSPVACYACKGRGVTS